MPDRPKIGIEFDNSGAEQALSLIERVRQAAINLNSGGGGVSAGGASAMLGGLSPSGAPNPMAGLPAPSGSTFGGFGPAATPSLPTGVLMPGMPAPQQAAVAPGALAPNPMSGSALPRQSVPGVSVSQPGPSGSFSGSGFPSGPVTIQAQQIVVQGVQGAGGPPPSFGGGGSAGSSGAPPPGTGGGGASPGAPSPYSHPGGGPPSLFGNEGGDRRGIFEYFGPRDIAQTLSHQVNNISGALLAEERGHILRSYGMTALDFRAEAVRRNSQIGAGAATAVGTVAGLVLTGGNPLGAVIGGGIGGAIGQIGGGLGENYAASLDVQSQIVLARARARGLGLGGELDPEWGTRRVRSSREMQERLFLDQLASETADLPGVFTLSRRQAMLDSTRTRSLPEGSPGLMAERMRARMQTALSMPELIDEVDAGGNFGLDSSERGRYRSIFAREGNFRGFSLSFGAGDGAEQRSMLREFQDYRRLQNRISLAGYGVQTAGGYTSERIALGAGGSEVVGLIGRQIGAQSDLVELLQGSLSRAQSMAGTPEGDRQIAEIRMQVQSALTELAQLRRSQVETGFQRRSALIGADEARGQIRTSRAMYLGGGEAGIIDAMGFQGTQARRRAGLYGEMSRSEFYSPEERAGFAMQSEQALNTALIELPRQIGQLRISLEQGRIGIAGAGAGMFSSMAELYGGRSDVLAGGIGQAGIIQRQMGLVNFQIQSARELRLTPQEELSLRQQQIDLQRQLNTSLEEMRRRFLDAGVAATRFQEGMIQAHGSMRMNFFGAGGGEAAGLQGENLGAARSTLAAARQRFNAVANLPRDNPYRMQAEREMHEAEMGVQGNLQGFASLPFSVDLERQRMAGSFVLNNMGRSFLPFGNIRGTLENMMGNVRSRGRELGAMQRSAMAELDSMDLSPEDRARRRSVLLRDFESRRYGLASEALGYQGQMEQGWQERLISQAVNMPSRAGFVASQFTRREAAPFLQTLTGLFGFSGEGGAAARDHFLFRGPRMLNSFIGQTQHPMGFLETAMSGASRANHGVLSPGGGGSGKNVESKIASLLAEAARLMGQLGMGNPIGPGKSSDALQNMRAVNNFLRPDYASGTSHQ